jgi:hypothetical protein
MSEHSHSASEAAEVIDRAREAETAIKQLCRATVGRSSMTPAEVDVVLAHLADAVAALPQAASQLADILGQAKDDHVLEMDTRPRPRIPTWPSTPPGFTSTRSANRRSTCTDYSMPLTKRRHTSP